MASDKQAETTQKQGAQRPRPASVYIGSRRDENYTLVLEKNLKAGRIPKILSEESRLVHEGDGPEGDRVIGYIRGLLDRLSHATMGKPCPTLRIVLSDVRGVGAGIITKANPPILVVGMGLIDMIEEKGFGEDHLAAILGHERFHLLRHLKWGDMKNGRPEESSGDVFGIYEAMKAGYNPQALGDVFRTLKAERQGGDSYGQGMELLDLMDVHPKLDDRIRNSELAIASQQLTQRMNNDCTPIPTDILAAARAVRHVSFFDRYKTQTGFDKASFAGKLALIGDYFLAELEKEELEVPSNKVRVDKKGNPVKDSQGRYVCEPCIEMERELQLIATRLFLAQDDLLALKDQDGVKEEAERQFARFMAIPHIDHELKQHYEWTLKIFCGLLTPDAPVAEIRSRHVLDANLFRIAKYKDVVPAQYLGLLRAAVAFWDAASREQVIASAQECEVAYADMKAYETGMRVLALYPEEPKWPSREWIRQQLKENGKMRLPWENHVQWGLAGGEDAELIKRVAMRLGCDDPRLTGCPIQSYRLGYASSGLELKFEHIHFDAVGDIVDLDYTDREKLLKFRARFEAETAAELYEREYKIQVEREKAEAALVKATDWMEMDRDFWGFIARHAEALEPTASIVPGRFPFAQAFMKRLRANVAQHPAQWNETYVSFVSGYDFTKTDKEREWSGEDKLIRPYSLPDLLRRSEEKYFQHGFYFDDFKHEFDGVRGALPEGHPMAGVLAAHHEEESSSFMTRRRKFKATPAEKQDVKIPIAVDHRHPYVRAILEYKGEIISPSRKANLISYFHYYDPDAKAMESYFRIDPRRAFNQAAMNTPGALNAYMYKTQRSQGYHNSSFLWRHAMPIEFLRTLRKYDETGIVKRFSLSGVNYFVATESFHFFNDKVLARTLKKELKKRVENQIRRNRRIDFRRKVPLNTLIKRFVADHKTGQWHSAHDIFAFRPRLEKSYLSHIRGRIMELPVAERAEPLQKLMALQLKEPAYRDWAINTWVESVVSVIGKDEGDSGYERQVLEKIRRTTARLAAAQGIGCVVRLLEKIEAQRKIALQAKEILINYYGRSFLEQDGVMRLIESAVATCSASPILRAAFLKYITEPLTKKGTQKFAAVVKKYSHDRAEKSFLGEFYDSQKIEVVSAAQERTLVDYLHRNFWSMPFELRTIYLDRILFPVGDESKEGFDKAVAFVFDKVLPPERKFAAEAREALLIYLDTCPKELRRTTFSAILATTEQASQKGDLRPGQVLSYVLTRTGAAGGQLLQAAHSYLSSLDIADTDLLLLRDDLKSSKVDFARPMPWEIFERMDEVLPPAMLAEIKKEHVGPVLGSGSTAYVVARRKADGSETAIKLMRKDVSPIADLQFERYEKAFRTLARRHAHYKSLPSMIDHARNLMRVTADGTIGRKQIDYVRASYAPLRVKVEGEWHDFNVARVVSAGPEYIETERIRGQHLNDMEPGRIKARRSAAIETAAVYRWLQGKATDRDQHGGQQGIRDTTIGMFDVAQTPFDVKRGVVAEPKPVEKRALGRLLGVTFNAAAAGGNVVAAFVDAVTTKDWGPAQPFLVGEQRALLARADMRAGLGEKEEARQRALKDIFKAVWEAGRIDADIFRGLAETISLKTCYRLAVQAAAGGGSSRRRIEIQDMSTANQAPRLSRLKMAGIVVRAGFKRVFGFI